MGVKNLYQKNSVKLNLSAWLPLVALVVGGVGCGNTENNKLAAQVPIQAVTINVSSALVMPTYTLNGAAFEQIEYNDGNFILRNTTSTGDTLVLGSSLDETPAAVRVIQDTYDVLFQHETGTGLPQNVDTQVQANEIVNSDRNLFIDVRAWEITPLFTQNTEAFPLNKYDTGTFYLQPNAGGERIFIGNGHTVPDPVQVMQGTYDVIYSLETGGDRVPNNQGAVVMSDVSVNADGPLDVDVASVHFQFDVTLDGAVFPLGQYQAARFFLRNTRTGDRVELGMSVELPVTLLVIEGTYDVVYQHVQGSDLPVNTDAVVASNIVIDSENPSQNIDIRSVAITPGFTLDGSAFPPDEYNDANFYLRAVNHNNDVMFLGASKIAPAIVRVISSDMDTDMSVGELLLGAYDVLYRHESGEKVPQNTNAVVPGKSNIVLNSDQSLAVPVTSVNITGRFTLNGNNFPDDANNSVQFLLRDSSDDSDEFLFGYSDISNEAVKLIPGTYHVVMNHLTGDAVPQNRMHEVDFNEELNEDLTLSVRVSAVRVDPQFTLDGQVFPASIHQSAIFYLRYRYNRGTEPRIFLGRSYKKNAPVMVLAEDHVIIYEHLNGGQVPQNMNNNVRIIDL